ncbi:YlzJ-like family protein [Desulfofalx alkaliphila]|uniref:YlzJ-like family protein n=1 Tax=Desulfofalx alkaliphila TaxID=105483 RepID=UPI0004E16BD4|nr:YlzJ-like family protein [Desulfofalx alkaliphila]
MILYTPMQLELVLEGIEPQFNNKQREVKIGSSTLIVEDSAWGSSRVVRLISTNPNDYLNPRYTPGTEIQI